MEFLHSSIIVYQMGKVGSNSIMRTLKNVGYNSFHIHYLNPDKLSQIERTYLSKNKPPPSHIATSRKILEHGVLKSPGCRIISLVREPISRNISAFFENRKLFDLYSSEKTPSIDEHINSFLKSYPHKVPLVWFDDEIKGELGIDVYRYSFPMDQGYLFLEVNNIKLLILKLETSDSSKEAALQEFLDKPSFDMQKANIGKEKDYADIYKSFLKRINLPENYIERMYNSKYTKHFYSDEEVQQLRYKWRRE